VSVGGIRVHRSIAGNLRRLLDAARADGIVLGGGGYRSTAGQIQTRRNNCGSSYYAIYQQPASSCRPPTARPGRSQHERGLAIDFTYGGNTICFPRRSSSCRGNAAYNWLKANAWRYGFYNLPSEAWHWSTTGS
jgi:LAS superfamily LD-carboxypeptidase LdcB